MINKPTTEISSLPFKYDQKRVLLNYLAKDLKEEIDQFEKDFKDFIQGLLISKIDKDLLELCKKPYIRSRTRICINGTKFGCPEKIFLDKEKKVYQLTTYYMDLDFPIPNNMDSFFFDFENDQIEMIKEGLIKFAELRARYSYYGWDMDLIGGSGRYFVETTFPNIHTLGQLYNANPEYYQIVYDNWAKYYIGDDSKELLNELIEILKK